MELTLRTREDKPALYLSFDKRSENISGASQRLLVFPNRVLLLQVLYRARPLLPNPFDRLLGSKAMANQIRGEDCAGSACALAAMNQHGFRLSILLVYEPNDLLQLIGARRTGNMRMQVVEPETVDNLRVERSPGQRDDGFNALVPHALQLRFSFWSSAPCDHALFEPAEISREHHLVPLTQPMKMSGKLKTKSRSLSPHSVFLSSLRNHTGSRNQPKVTITFATNSLYLRIPRLLSLLRG